MSTRTAIVLLNLGGPQRLADVKPFLRALFTDRDIIRLGPAWLQPALARLIVALRLRTVKGRYQSIGGGSPILRETALQATALRKVLRDQGRQEKVVLCFRYTRPRAAGLLRSLQAQGITHLLPVTLYPHDCRATTGSSLRELEREATLLGMTVLPGVLHYATEPDYLDALEERLRHTLSKAPEATVIFSAHSLPQSQIDAGDPYERDIQATVEALKARLGAIPGGYRLGYQSKVGPVKWLEPSLDAVLAERKGHAVVLLPVSFVGEHIETLHELDQEYREKAEAYGVTGYHRVPALGLHPTFIHCLARLTVAALDRAEEVP